MTTILSGIAIAAAISMIVGMAWYSPRVFGSVWAKSAGMTAEAIEEGKGAGMGRIIGFAFVNALVTALVLQIFILAMGADSWQIGAQIGVLVWLGFLLTAGVSRILWERKPLAWLWVTAGHDLISFALMGAFLGSWR